MEILKRKMHGKTVEFEIYSKEEADEKELEYYPWREARGGDWALSDDGYVSKMLKVMEYRKGNKSRTLFVLPYTRVWYPGKTQVEWLEKKVTKDYHNTGNASWVEKEAKKQRTKRAIELYVAQLLTGKVDWHQIGTAYRPDQKIPEATVRRLFKQERIKTMVREEVRKVMEAKCLTVDDAIETLLTAQKIAEAENDAGTVLRVYKEKAALLEMESQKRLPESEGDWNQIADAAEQSAKLTQGDHDKA